MKSVDVKKNENAEAKIPFANPKGPDAIKASVSEAVEKACEAPADNVIEIKRAVAEEDEEIDLLVKFSNTYRFEDMIIEEIDLSGLKELTTMDVTAAEKIYFSGGNFAPVSELTAAYCITLAAQGCKYPLELLQALKANDTTKIKNKVSTFLLS